jgi:hypothetical protein
VGQDTKFLTRIRDGLFALLKNRRSYLYLGVALTVIGVISPWWCRGHLGFLCTNALGLSFNRHELFGYLSFTPAVGIGMPILLTWLVWIELRKHLVTGKKNIAVSLLILALWLFTAIDTVLLVREENICQGFAAWTTRYVEFIFPTTSSCEHLGPNLITDIARGIWITLAGILILVSSSLARSLSGRDTD